MVADRLEKSQITGMEVPLLKEASYVSKRGERLVKSVLLAWARSNAYYILVCSFRHYRRLEVAAEAKGPGLLSGSEDFPDQKITRLYDKTLRPGRRVLAQEANLI